MKYIKNILIVLFVLLLSFIVWFVLFKMEVDEKFDYVTFDNAKFSVEIADDLDERIKGLSGVKELKPDSGMLFVFDKPEIQGIWMKDMYISLDIIWLDSDLKVIHIEQNISSETYPMVYRSEKEALYVLEIPSGTVSKYGIKLGDTAQFNLL